MSKNVLIVGGVIVGTYAGYQLLRQYTEPKQVQILWAEVVNPYVHRGQPAEMDVNFFNPGPGSYDATVKLGLRARHDWHGGEYVDLVLSPGESETLRLTREVQDDWPIGDYLDARIRQRFSSGGWLPWPFGTPKRETIDTWNDIFQVVG